MDFGQDRSSPVEAINRPRLQVALIGAGNFGVELAEYVREVADLVAVCDPSAESRSLLIKSLGRDLAEYEETGALFADKEFDAVVITSPHHTHRQITVEAARAGKHVYCEKAMANTVPECWEMVRACEQANIRLMIGHKRRLRPPWRE